MYIELENVCFLQNMVWEKENSNETDYYFAVDCDSPDEQSQVVFVSGRKMDAALSNTVFTGRIKNHRVDDQIFNLAKGQLDPSHVIFEVGMTPRKKLFYDILIALGSMASAGLLCYLVAKVLRQRKKQDIAMAEYMEKINAESPA